MINHEYTLPKHLQNITIGLVFGGLVGVLLGVYSAWESSSLFWAVAVPSFVTLIYGLIILIPTYWICKYWDIKDKKLNKK
jgi:ABC-type dipeptide/oligopeptide/nickel transport system permease component